MSEIKKMMSNAEKYPECWEFFIEHARNMEGEPEAKIAKYRIPKPDHSGEFIHDNCPGKLFEKFKNFWYQDNLNSMSIYGKIQYIVNNF